MSAVNGAAPLNAAGRGVGKVNARGLLRQIAAEERAARPSPEEQARALRKENAELRHENAGLRREVRKLRRLLKRFLDEARTLNAAEAG